MTEVPGRDAPSKTGDDAAAAANSVDQYPAAAKAEQVDLRSCPDWIRPKPPLKKAHVAKPKLRIATRGESPTGDDEDRHAGSESCEIVRKYTGDRDLEA
jgi:hypothetical protein